jgi:hypothetical protein
MIQIVPCDQFVFHARFSHTTVATAQATQLSTEESALNVQQQRLLNTVSLIGDLGGDWPASALDGDERMASEAPTTACRSRYRTREYRHKSALTTQCRAGNEGIPLLLASSIGEGSNFKEQSRGIYV